MSFKYSLLKPFFSLLLIATKPWSRAQSLHAFVTSFLGRLVEAVGEAVPAEPGSVAELAGWAGAHGVTLRVCGCHGMILTLANFLTAE